MERNVRQSGQVLLIVVLVSTVLLTVGLSLSQVTTEETRISHLEQEGKRAFAAADAGIDAGLKRLKPGDAPLDISTLGLGGGIGGQVTVAEVQSPTFTTPLLKRNEQYTFYLATYDPNQKKITGAASTDALKVSLASLDGTYCDSPTNTKPALTLELTFTNKDTGAVTTRRLIDPCNLVDGTADEVAFGDQIDLAALASHLIVMRVVSSSAGFKSARFNVINDEAPANNWPPQGKTVTSVANTPAGVEKKIELFQAYPQFLADFFVTRF